MLLRQHFWADFHFRDLTMLIAAAAAQLICYLVCAAVLADMTCCRSWVLARLLGEVADKLAPLYGIVGLSSFWGTCAEQFAASAEHGGAVAPCWRGCQGMICGET